MHRVGRPYICRICGSEMDIVDDGMTLYCTNCGYDVSIEDYGTQYEDECTIIPILYSDDDL